MSKHKSPFLTLEQFIKEGTIFVSGSTYVGKADDGVEVDLGAVGCEASLREYLESHPTPSHW